MTIFDSLSSLFSNLLAMLPSDIASASAPTSSSPPERAPQPWSGEPTIIDVLAVKSLFSTLQPPLPTELIDIIIDHAEYWPHTTSFPHAPCRVNQDGNVLVTWSLPLGYPDTSVPVTAYPLRAEDYASVAHNSQRLVPPQPFMSENSETTTRILDAWKEVSMPDTRLEFPCKKIVVNIRSHDQGWGGQHHLKGTYEGSYTWFDIGLQRVKGMDMSQLPASALSPDPQRAESSSESDSDPDSEDEHNAQGKRFPQLHNRGTSRAELEGWDGLRFDLEQVDPPFKPPSASQTSERWQRDALDHPFLPNEKTLQRNLLATGSFADHEIVLRWDDDVDPESEYAQEVLEKGMGRGKELLDGRLMRGLRVGDVVNIWARARFAGWCNVVEKVSVSVYWAV